MKRLAMVNSDGKAIPALLDPDGITTRLYDLRLRVFARTPYDQLLTELGTLDAAEAAIADDCDAIYIDTMADYAIERVRIAAKVPVIGAGEASIAAASRGGRTFSIVTVWPLSMSYLYEERLANCRGGEHCLGVHYFSFESELDNVGLSRGIQARMMRRESRLVEQLAQACRRAVATDGSAAVLLGCTCMSPVAAQIQESCDFPVLDPSKQGLQAAFDALLTGQVAPPSVATSPRIGAAPLLVTAWLGGPGAHDSSPDECEVCAIAHPGL